MELGAPLAGCARGPAKNGRDYGLVPRWSEVGAQSVHSPKGRPPPTALSEASGYV